MGREEAQLLAILRTQRVTAYSAEAKTLRPTRAAVEKDCESKGAGKGLSLQIRNSEGLRKRN